MNKWPKVGEEVVLRHVSIQNKAGLAFSAVQGKPRVGKISQVLDNGKITTTSGDMFEIVPNQIKGFNCPWMTWE